MHIHSKSFLTLLMAFLCGVCVNPACAEAPPLRHHWQYASLLTSTRLAKWTSPEAEKLQEGDGGYVKLYVDMGGTKPTAKVTLIDLLNLIGEQGWELVAVDGGEGPHQYIFKRSD